MNDVELTNRAIDFLHKQHGCNSSRGRRISAKEVADAVGGYAPSVGRCYEAILAELLKRGHAIRYDRTSTPKCFVLN